MGAGRPNQATLCIALPIGPSCSRSSPTRRSNGLQALHQVRTYPHPVAFGDTNGLGAFKTWAPRLFSYYADHLSALTKHDPSNRVNFPNSVWAAATFNFGPNTACFKHRDSANLPFGWCGITSLGSFDPTRGGHLVLWDCRLVVEFPPGSTALVPSAAIAHSNTSISPSAGEKRYSFTQYTSGGIFRWVDQGFQKTEVYRGGLTEEGLSDELTSLSTQLETGLKLFSTLEELRRSTVAPPET